MNFTQASKSTGLAVMLTALLALSIVGCGQPSNVTFQRSIDQGARALSTGDLDTADMHIEQARDAAQTYEEQRQAEDLQQLSTGARAMMDGDVAEGRQHWAAIRDPRLNRQVRSKAAGIMDIQVPAAPTASMESEVR